MPQKPGAPETEKNPDAKTPGEKNPAPWKPAPEGDKKPEKPMPDSNKKPEEKKSAPKGDADRKSAPKFKPQSPRKPETPKASAFPFTDVAENHWARPAIAYVAEKGYFNGKDKAVFAPNDAVTRGEFVTVLGRMAKVRTAEYTGGDFVDVARDRYYAPYIHWAAQAGLVQGIGNRKFDPDRPVTREEMAKIVEAYIQYLKKQPAQGASVAFQDADRIAPWAK
ncbi:Endoglucanase precursor [Aedoeadaptatus ivorii]|uniref:Endoglucanase n=1 Tax=Aedoeadaptatus ivorii TaxID=54006 RepID=A0A448V2T7_9FIRM|nr:S-layer homology domain-containing protein [Peptoniphilus ivorii]VEJ36103.1 Endoglucanase precursor [Peptoniphilus ivorii]